MNELWTPDTAAFRRAVLDTARLGVQLDRWSRPFSSRLRRHLADVAETLLQQALPMLSRAPGTPLVAFPMRQVARHLAQYPPKQPGEMLLQHATYAVATYEPNPELCASYLLALSGLLGDLAGRAGRPPSPGQGAPLSERDNQWLEIMRLAGLVDLALLPRRPVSPPDPLALIMLLKSDLESAAQRDRLDVQQLIARRRSELAQGVGDWATQVRAQLTAVLRQERLVRAAVDLEPMAGLVVLLEQYAAGDDAAVPTGGLEDSST